MEATAGSSDKTSPNNQFPKRAPLVAASLPAAGRFTSFTVSLEGPSTVVIPSLPALM
jgi:hypothetical protein